jgi:hypothetical protein
MQRRDEYTACHLERQAATSLQVLWNTCTLGSWWQYSPNLYCMCRTTIKRLNADCVTLPAFRPAQLPACPPAYSVGVQRSLACGHLRVLGNRCAQQYSSTAVRTAEQCRRTSSLLSTCMRSSTHSGTSHWHCMRVGPHPDLWL